MDGLEKKSGGVRAAAVPVKGRNCLASITIGRISQVLIGDASVLAIESEITHAYERRSFLALGFFAIHVSGRTMEGVRLQFNARLLA